MNVAENLKNERRTETEIEKMNEGEKQKIEK